MEELAAMGTVTARSQVISTAPMGPSARRYANAAVVLETELDPQALLAALQWTEGEFGRKRWRRWGDRVLDLDIVLWSGGPFAAPGLVIPHPAFRQRGFVLGPASTIAPTWRDPNTDLTLQQAKARLTRKRPLP